MMQKKTEKSLFTKDFSVFITHFFLIFTVIYVTIPKQSTALLFL